MYTNFTKEEKGTSVLLFLHGWGCDGSVFQSISGQLNATSYLLDLWGFGASEAPSKAWSVTDYARQLKAFCDSQGLRQFGIVCHSFGARVAVVFAAMYPDMVDRLLITGGAGLRRFSVKRWCRVCRYKLAKRLAGWGLYKGDLPKGSADYAILQGAMKQTFVKVVNQDLSRYARRIKCPTLLVWGKDDVDTPLWMGKRYNRLIAKSSLVVLEGSHFAFLSQANRFAMIARYFVEGD